MDSFFQTPSPPPKKISGPANGEPGHVGASPKHVDPIRARPARHGTNLAHWVEDTLFKGSDGDRTQIHRLKAGTLTTSVNKERYQALLGQIS
ncbi:hypothetical protein QJS10_CPB13g00093 [Acorus calamus]|uniref:Uncharacterized protein n=1 Tax=Acorus calamus TaxID=4465 RepID=A0AAV9DKJ1_ACOCL|nr:hypothetical protein QJS10_CPB13g00093 [Acorus calamus]